MSVNGSTPSRVHVLDGNKSNSLLYRHEGAVACSRGEKTGPPRYRRVRGPGDLGEEVMGEPWTPPGYGIRDRAPWGLGLCSPTQLTHLSSHQGDETRCPQPRSGSLPSLPEGFPSPRPGEARPLQPPKHSNAELSVGARTTLISFSVASPTQHLPRCNCSTRTR